MSRAMSKDEFLELMTFIRKEHSPKSLATGKKCIKYVYPAIDMRDGAVFAVSFEGYGWSKKLHTQNESKDLSESLLERCIAFLSDDSTEDLTHDIVPFII